MLAARRVPFCACALPLDPTTQGTGLLAASAFNWDEYFTALESARLGQTVLHFDTVSSTQTVLDSHPAFLASVPDTAGLVVVANR